MDLKNNSDSINQLKNKIKTSQYLKLNYKICNTAETNYETILPTLNLTGPSDDCRLSTNNAIW